LAEHFDVAVDHDVIDVGAGQALCPLWLNLVAADAALRFTLYVLRLTPHVSRQITLPLFHKPLRFAWDSQF